MNQAATANASALTGPDPSVILFRTRIYEGPCPENIEDAERALEHLNSGPRLFLTSSMRVNANVSDKDAQMYGLEEEVNEMKAFQGALICWKGDELPIDLEKFLGSGLIART
jgi:hypothetical protein